MMRFVIRKSKSANQGAEGRLLVAELAKIPKKNMENFLLSSIKSYHYVVWNVRFYWSISHKGDWLAVAVHNKPVGIDIELNQPRDRSMFKIFSVDEWKTLGRKSWLNFYRGWTAKESALKALSLRLKDLKSVVICGKLGNKIYLKSVDRKLTAINYIIGRKVIAVSSQNTGN